jgi:hypothetical protein
VASRNVLRELLVRLGVQVNPQTPAQVKAFHKQVEQLKKEMQDLDGYVAAVGQGLKRLALAGVAALGGLGALSLETGRHAENVERQAKALNLTRKEFQEYEHVFGTFGADSKEISEAFLQLTQMTVQAEQGQKSAAQAFGLIGIRIDQLRGKRPNELFELVADAMAKTANRQNALAAASSLFGEDTAKKLLPALVSGSKGIRALRVEAHELGLVMNDDALRAGKEVSVQWRTLTNTVKGLGQELGVRFAPIVIRVLKGINDWVKANRALLSQRLDFWTRQIERAATAADLLVRLLGGWQAALINLATGAGFVYLLVHLEDVLKLLRSIRIATELLGIATEPVLDAIGLGLETIGVELAPLLLIVGALVAPFVLLGLAVDDFVTFWEGGRSVLGDNLDLIQSYVPAFGAVRHLFGALIGLGGAAFGTIAILARAIALGFTPALQLLDRALQPVIDGLTALQAIWDALNFSVGARVEQLALFVRSIGFGAQGTAAGIAPVVSAGVASSVQNQISRISSSSSTDNSNRQVSQINNFLGGGSATDHLRAMEPALRKAGLAVAGGRR